MKKHFQNCLFSEINIVTGQDMASVADVLSDSSKILRNGGLLFKSRLQEQTFRFGILPAFQHGQRMYHYDIPFDVDPMTLIGCINTNKTVSALFRMDKPAVDVIEDKKITSMYRNQYQALAIFLVSCGMKPETRLDPPSASALTAIGLDYAAALNLTTLAGIA